MKKPNPELVWQVILRFLMGGYWIFFSHQKWFDRSWVVRMINAAAEGNYLPIYAQVLRGLVAPNSSTVALVITIIEGMVGVMLILGVLTRFAAIVGSLLDLNLTMMFSFCNCPSVSDLAVVFWFYFAAFLLNFQLIFDRSSQTLGLQALIRRMISNYQTGN